jgi:predicted HicB family RNase H-like nuclease
MSPTPSSPETARVLLRLPRDLHDELKQIAKAQGVSVNTLLVAMAAGGARWLAVKEPRAA